MINHREMKTKIKAEKKGIRAMNKTDTFLNFK